MAIDIRDQERLEEQFRQEASLRSFVRHQVDILKLESPLDPSATEYLSLFSPLTGSVIRLMKSTNDRIPLNRSYLERLKRKYSDSLKNMLIVLSNNKDQITWTLAKASINVSRLPGYAEDGDEEIYLKLSDIYTPSGQLSETCGLYNLDKPDDPVIRVAKLRSYERGQKSLVALHPQLLEQFQLAPPELAANFALVTTDNNTLSGTARPKRLLLPLSQLNTADKYLDNESDRVIVATNWPPRQLYPDRKDKESIKGQSSANKAIQEALSSPQSDNDGRYALMLQGKVADEDLYLGMLPAPDPKIDMFPEGVLEISAHYLLSLRQANALAGKRLILVTKIKGVRTLHYLGPAIDQLMRENIKDWDKILTIAAENPASTKLETLLQKPLRLTLPQTVLKDYPFHKNKKTNQTAEQNTREGIPDTRAEELEEDARQQKADAKRTDSASVKQVTDDTAANSAKPLPAKEKTKASMPKAEKKLVTFADYKEPDNPKHAPDYNRSDLLAQQKAQQQKDAELASAQAKNKVPDNVAVAASHAEAETTKSGRNQRYRVQAHREKKENKTIQKERKPVQKRKHLNPLAQMIAALQIQTWVVLNLNRMARLFQAQIITVLQRQAPMVLNLNPKTNQNPARALMADLPAAAGVEEEMMAVMAAEPKQQRHSSRKNDPDLLPEPDQTMGLLEQGYEWIWRSVRAHPYYTLGLLATLPAAKIALDTYRSWNMLPGLKESLLKKALNTFKGQMTPFQTTALENLIYGTPPALLEYWRPETLAWWVVDSTNKWCQRNQCNSQELSQIFLHHVLAPVSADPERFKKELTLRLSKAPLASGDPWDDALNLRRKGFPAAVDIDPVSGQEWLVTLDDYGYIKQAFDQQKLRHYPAKIYRDNFIMTRKTVAEYDRTNRILNGRQIIDVTSQYRHTEAFPMERQRSGVFICATQSGQRWKVVDSSGKEPGTYATPALLGMSHRENDGWCVDGSMGNWLAILFPDGNVAYLTPDTHKKPLPVKLALDELFHNHAKEKPMETSECTAQTWINRRWHDAEVDSIEKNEITLKLPENGFYRLICRGEITTFTLTPETIEIWSWPEGSNTLLK